MRGRENTGKERKNEKQVMWCRRRDVGTYMGSMQKMDRRRDKLAGSDGKNVGEKGKRRKVDEKNRKGQKRERDR